MIGVLGRLRPVAVRTVRLVCAGPAQGLGGPDRGGGVCRGTAASILWFVGALLFRRRFQFGIRSLLLLALIVALLCGWMTVKIRAAKEQHDAVEAIKGDGWILNEVRFSTITVARFGSGKPAEPKWLRELLEMTSSMMLLKPI